MRNFNLFAVSLTMFLIFIGCNQNPVGTSNGSTELGSAQVNIQIGRIGQLSKVTADLELAKLFINLSAPGEATINDTVSLTSNSGTSFLKTYDDMASLKTWTLFVVSVDKIGTVIHTGSKTFQIQPRKTEPVNLNLNSKYSMLKINFYPIRDSVTKCEVKLNGVTINDSILIKQALVGDTVKMSYNYMDTGKQHIALNVYGTMWGDANILLYTADTTIAVLTGVDASHTVRLVWVGPTTPPTGQASMSVSLGSTGTTVINGYIDSPLGSTETKAITITSKAITSYRFYRFAIDDIGFGAYVPCLITTHFLKGDTAYPRSFADYTVIEAGASVGTVQDLMMGTSYLKPSGGTKAEPWQWIVDMHEAQIFTAFYYTVWEVGFYSVPTSVTIYGGDSSDGPWNVIGQKVFTEVYCDATTIPLSY